jgi:hypothetical protein
MDAPHRRDAHIADRSPGGLTVYGSLWRVLPGPVWVRVLLLIALLTVVLYVLGTWAFPWVQSFIDPQEVTVEE